MLQTYLISHEGYIRTIAQIHAPAGRHTESAERNTENIVKRARQSPARRIVDLIVTG